MVFVKEQERRILILGIVGNQQIRRVPNEDPLGIKGMMVSEDLHDLPIKPRLQEFGFGPPGHLAHIIVITRCLTVERILRIKSVTYQRHVPRLGMDRLMTHLGTEGLDHAPRTDHIGEGMKGMNPMKPHGNITGQVDPHGNIVLLTSRGVRIGKLT